MNTDQKYSLRLVALLGIALLSGCGGGTPASNSNSTAADAATMSRAQALTPAVPGGSPTPTNPATPATVDGGESLTFVGSEPVVLGTSESKTSMSLLLREDWLESAVTDPVLQSAQMLYAAGMVSKSPVEAPGWVSVEIDDAGKIIGPGLMPAAIAEKLKQEELEAGVQVFPVTDPPVAGGPNKPKLVLCSLVVIETDHYIDRSGIPKFMLTPRARALSKWVRAYKQSLIDNVLGKDEDGSPKFSVPAEDWIEFHYQWREYDDQQVFVRAVIDPRTGRCDESVAANALRAIKIKNKEKELLAKDLISWTTRFAHWEFTHRSYTPTTWFSRTQDSPASDAYYPKLRESMRIVSRLYPAVAPGSPAGSKTSLFLANAEVRNRAAADRTAEQRKLLEAQGGLSGDFWADYACDPVRTNFTGAKNPKFMALLVGCGKKIATYADCAAQVPSAEKDRDDWCYPSDRSGVRRDPTSPLAVFFGSYRYRTLDQCMVDYCGASDLPVYNERPPAN